MNVGRAWGGIVEIDLRTHRWIRLSIILVKVATGCFPPGIFFTVAPLDRTFFGEVQRIFVEPCTL
jgi:hypothetical protein